MDTWRERLMHLPQASEWVVPWAVFAILMSYTYVELVETPYVGFNFSSATGEITPLFVSNVAGSKLVAGDKLKQVDSVTWDHYRGNLRQPLFGMLTPGDKVTLYVERQGQLITIPWHIQPFNLGEFLDRLTNVWLLGLLFWLAGILTILLIRPRDDRWRLMIAFYLLTALWLVIGNTSRWHHWESAILFRMVIWISIPVYLQLHWVFPLRLKPLPTIVWQSGYAMSVTLAFFQWFQWIPPNVGLLGFLFAVAGSALLLVVQYCCYPDNRNQIRLVFAAVIVTLLLLIVVSLGQALALLPWYGTVGFLGLPLLPGAYFYVAYQGQLGGLVIRSNQLLGKYLFILLILILYIGLATIAAARVAVTGHLFFVGLIAALISIVVAVTGYAPFQRFVEQYLLRMPLPTQQLAEVFATRIAANLELHGLITLWQDELLPSLLVRESAMLQLRDNQQITIIAQVGIRNDQTPNHTELPLLLEKATASKRLKPGQVGERLVWVRMILPLRIGKEVSGFWLFGARDPNDHYSRAELSSFQALADQMAIALLNIEQATLLRTLYTTNVDRHELERQRLAHELHDDLLNDIATLALLIPDTDAALEVERSFQALIQKIRHLITGLRPAMLTYGLYAALEELTDDLSDRFGVSLAVRFDIAPSEARFPIRVEQQLFRIIQQACENALRHARTEDLYVYGAIQTNRVSVTVSDHGVGFDLGQDIDWAQLQQDKHFGLIGMYERAKLIGADLQIQSQPGQGTTVSVQWASQDGVEYD